MKWKELDFNNIIFFIEEMLSNKKLKLRFKDENGNEFPEWEEKKLGEITIRVVKKCIKKEESLPVLTNSATQGIVSQLDYFNKDITNEINLNRYYVCDLGQFVYNPRISNNAPVGPVKRNNLTKGIMSPLYTIFQIINADALFLEKYFDTKVWHKYIKSVANYGARHDRINIKTEDFFSLSIFLPSLPEQQKISSFLILVDKKIELLNKKKELLEKYKKGVMQKIFKQEIRFKDENGNEFPEWEEKKLGDICKIKTGKLDANAMSSEGKYRFYTCAAEYCLIDSYEFDKEALIISGNGANVGYIHYYRGKFNAYQRTYVLFNFSENIHYLKLFLTRFLHDRIEKEKKSGNTPYIVLSTLKDMLIKTPKSTEQHKIASYLINLDDRIESHIKNIKQTELFKKALLQKMFI